MVRRINTRDDDIAAEGRLFDEVHSVTSEDLRLPAAALYGSDQHIEVTRVRS